MKRQKGQKFAEKHESNAQLNEKIKDHIIRQTKNNELPCAVAFKIDAELNVSPAEVGKTVDLLELMLVKCQLGLFGYHSNKKMIMPNNVVDPDVKIAISEALIDEKLPCKSAWEIASRFNIRKMAVGGLCEALKVKIKPCQIGAF